MEKFDKKLTGERIRFLRKEKSMSQKTLAALIGVSHTTIGMYENGHSSISLEVFFRLVEVLETTADYLLGF